MKAYYNRTMSSKIESVLKENGGKYYWMIQYVKDHPELDFQTGSNNGSSWFSIYRGTSRVLKITTSGKVSADKAYKGLLPSFYENPNPELFDKLLTIVNGYPKFDRYYAKCDCSDKKEGYFQNLIARRYTFNNKPEDDFVIIDKELVIGFKDKDTEAAWNAPISKELASLIQKARETLSPTRLPVNIKSKYGEFDFLGLNWDGDIIIMELKQDDPNKTYLSPVQICYYKKQFTKLLKEIPNLYDDIIRMVNQKIKLGLINVPQGRKLPTKLSGRIKSYLIVGEESGLSKEVCRRYGSFKDIVLPDMEAFTCDSDGTLVRCKTLE